MSTEQDAEKSSLSSSLEVQSTSPIPSQPSIQQYVQIQDMDSFDKTSALVKDLITFILTAQTGLIGTALGFYFGSRVSPKD